MSDEPMTVEQAKVIMSEHEGHRDGCHWRRLAIDVDEPEVAEARSSKAMDV